MIVYAVVDDALSPDLPLGDSLEVFMRREDAERFIEEVRGDDPRAAEKLRIEERDLGDRADDVSVDDPVAGRALEIVKDVLESFEPPGQPGNGRP